jgi:hypothetical protein
MGMGVRVVMGMILLRVGDIAIDYSFARPNPQAIVDAGVRLVVRYISPRRSNAKNLTIAERDRLLGVGLGILLVWENVTTDPLGGETLGAVHGALAGQYAEDLGYPRNMPVIIAVDFGAQVGQLPVVWEYVRAFAGTCGFPVGVYGSDSVVTACADVSVLGWQTRAWSYGRRSVHAHVLQEIGVVHPSVGELGAVDDNTVLREFTAWSLEVPKEREDCMYFKDDRSDWQIWEVKRDWTDALYARVINTMPRQGDWVMLDALGVQPYEASYEALDAIRRQQGEPTPAKVLVPVIVTDPEAVGKVITEMTRRLNVS